jgi:lipopolysaccharide/colanic/teichoic acid biosynthesis glycosyltransferase
MKRILDILIALGILIVSSPLAVMIALGTKLDSPGPVIISTRRVGRGGQLFSHYRFRTMAGSPLQKTRFGRFIGNRSLDDLPTLWNVLRGDMSLIGPRPEVPEKVDLSDATWRKVLSVRPGLSGLGLLTLRKRYNQASVPERLQPEVYYAKHSSLLFDVQLILQTLYWWLRMGHLKGRF